MPQETEDIAEEVEIPAEVVTEDVATEVVPEETAEETGINFDDFEGTKTEVKEAKIEEKKTEEVKKEEVKPDDKTGKPLVATEKKPVVKVARDYSGLPEDKVPLFKTMSNETFAALKPFYIEAQDIKVKYDALLAAPKPEAGKPTIPDNYYEHPEGYTLTPEYNKAAMAANEGQLVLDHYRAQLDEVRNGATEFTPLARDAQGQIVYGAPQKVDHRTQSLLESTFFTKQQQATQLAQSLGAMQNEFKTKHATALADVRAFEKEQFPLFEDSKHPANKIIDDTLQKINPVFRSNPLARLVAKYAFTTQMLTKALEDAKTTKIAATVADKTKTAQAKAGPTASGVVAETKSKDEDVSWDDFNKRMES